MQRVLLLSIGLHALALASVLALRMPALAEPDAPPRIEVVFGTSGAAPPAPVAAAAPDAPAPPAADPPHASDGEPQSAPAAPASPYASQRPAAPAPGLRVDRPDASMIPARDAIGNHAPDYPQEARRLHQEGTVLLRLHIGVDGVVARIETLQSSGVVELDEAARAALARWHFLPAMRDGQAVASYRDQPVSFVLD